MKRFRHGCEDYMRFQPNQMILTLRFKSLKCNCYTLCNFFVVKTSGNMSVTVSILTCANLWGVLVCLGLD